jgi:hypothetical protein
MSLRLLIFDHPRIRLLLLHPVIAIVMTCKSEPYSAGSVPRDPPPTGGDSEEVKERSRGQVEQEGKGEQTGVEGEADGVVQEPPD